MDPVDDQLIKDLMFFLFVTFFKQSHLVVNLLIRIKDAKKKSRDKTREQLQAEMLIGNFNWLFNTITGSLEAASDAGGLDAPLNDVTDLCNMCKPIIALLKTSGTSSQR
jgi:hypothetical protein